jgi:hypothetical protein
MAFLPIVDILFVTKGIVDGLMPGLCSILEWCAVFACLAWVAFASLDSLGHSAARRFRAPGRREPQPPAERGHKKEQRVDQTVRES